MNKLMEYMILGKAIVSYDLKETRVSGADTIAYAAGNNYADLAAAIALLLDDASLRDRLGRAAHDRVLEKLAWPHQESNLLNIYYSLFPGRVPSNGRA